MTKKRLIIISGFILALGVVGYLLIGRTLWGSNVKFSEDSKAIFIPTDASFDDLMQIMTDSSILKSNASFLTVAKLMKYKKPKAGRYLIKKNQSNREIITKLRSGDQDPHKIVVNNIRTIHDLAGKASRYFETDSLTFLQYLTDVNTASSFGFTNEDFLTMFIPNTYEMFWTTTPDKFVTRMKKEYDGFWDDEKLEKIKKHNLDKTQAYIVASIVEKESNYDPERPAIAGVYLNRLKAGEKLQADPTVVFATGEFTLQRVLFSHLKIDSPYNTYMYSGLPPGPICMPSVSSLNAVINAEDHEYMFFCAKPDNSGIHAFARDYGEHQKNAAAFSAWLNSLNIK
ncbi:MAG: endolytic transglycosylase MltG [Saprospiraceae bacterium]|nr:endolytic transglycosylase MltG [Saprospiraceae bacterium]